MEKNSSINNHHQNRERVGGGGVFNGNSGDNNNNNNNNNNNLVRTNTHPPETRSNNNNHNNLASTTTTTTSSDFVLQWGNKKRLRCMKVQSKDREGSSSATARFDRRPVVRSDLINGSKDKDCTNNNAFINLRHSPSHRVTRNSEGTVAMKGGQSNGASDKRANGAHHNTAATTTTTANTNHNSNNNNHNHHINNNNNNVNNGGVGSGSGSDTVHDSKKCGTSSGSDAMPAVWPPKFVIGLTNKEKEEDFYAFKGSKLPQRPKKRAKFIQRTLNLVSPGAWLCDLTLERYEVREKKISKKRPRGLKAMGNMESDSE